VLAEIFIGDTASSCEDISFYILIVSASTEVVLTLSWCFASLIAAAGSKPSATFDNRKLTGARSKKSLGGLNPFSQSFETFSSETCSLARSV
jgi:hypothetical protein